MTNLQIRYTKYSVYNKKEFVTKGEIKRNKSLSPLVSLTNGNASISHPMIHNLIAKQGTCGGCCGKNVSSTAQWKQYIISQNNPKIYENVVHTHIRVLSVHKPRLCII